MSLDLEVLFCKYADKLYILNGILLFKGYLWIIIPIHLVEYVMYFPDGCIDIVIP